VRAATALSATRFTDEDRARFRETTALTLAVPEIRARALDEFTRTLDIFANALAKRTGRDPDDLAVRTMAGAIFGVIMELRFRSWRAARWRSRRPSPRSTRAWPCWRPACRCDGLGRAAQRTPRGRNCTLIRGPVARLVFGTACSKVRWQLPPITSRSPWPCACRDSHPWL
jgi:MftR C-terminal domain